MGAVMQEESSLSMFADLCVLSFIVLPSPLPQVASSVLLAGVLVIGREHLEKVVGHSEL